MLCKSELWCFLPLWPKFIMWSLIPNLVIDIIIPRNRFLKTNKKHVLHKPWHVAPQQLLNIQLNILQLERCNTPPNFPRQLCKLLTWSKDPEAFVMLLEEHTQKEAHMIMRDLTVLKECCTTKNKLKTFKHTCLSILGILLETSAILIGSFPEKTQLCGQQICKYILFHKKKRFKSKVNKQTQCSCWCYVRLLKTKVNSLNTFVSSAPLAAPSGPPKTLIFSLSILSFSS